jgi:hypothetical protein
MNQNGKLSVISLSLAGGSLLILPPFLGLAAFVLGIMAVVKKEKLGVLALVLSIVLPAIGMFVGAALAVSAMQ